jgi:hypothetical protein
MSGMCTPQLHGITCVRLITGDTMGREVQRDLFTYLNHDGTYVTSLFQA